MRMNNIEQISKWGREIERNRFNIIQNRRKCIERNNEYIQKAE